MWITLTEADVRTRLSGPELSALKSAALGRDQVDPLPETILQVVREVRGYVAGNRSNTLGADGTIPNELTAAALNRIRYELATRLPVQSLLTDARKEANRDAVKLLQDVSRGAFLIVQPETASESQVDGSPVEIVSKTTRRATRQTLDGI